MAKAQTQELILDNDRLSKELPGSVCERDNVLLSEHNWAELDTLGYVVNCEVK